MLNADLDAGVEGTQHGTEGLAALVSKPRVNLTRFQAVFAPLCPLGATANTVRW